MEKPPAKMEAIAEQARQALNGSLPFLTIHASDGLMSDVWIKGTVEPKEEWTNGIFHNAHYLMVQISPPKGARWFDGSDLMTVEVSSCNVKPVKPMRKYTGPAQKVIAKIAAFIAEVKAAHAK